MAYDRDERVNAERKEGDNGLAEMFDQRDTEFADSWMGAVLDENTVRSQGNIQYDPHTQTERYLGEQSVDAAGADLTQQVNREGDKRGDNRPDASPLTGDDVETAAEIAEPIRETRTTDDVDAQAENGASGIGWTGLGLSILSLFLLPYIVAPIGMVLGYLAYRRNARTLGVWAMIVGAIAILGALIIYPYYIAR
ncbi:hypothetical protein [Brevibacillus thermoruber]|jgi:hypothetical protein|uniref:hypothetical protein n=1 Tax=Brevibacillus thermoruber TaxID=33942 RepID=UPI0003F63FAD|nr:hypothetical protein [Brevibacillus thermoruber]